MIARLASALGISIPAALIASFPAAVRCSASATSSVGLVSAWPALAGTLVLPMAVAVLALRGARDGLAELAGNGAGNRPLDVIDPLALPAVPDEHVPSRASLLRAAVVGWGALVCAGLAPLGALLRARTHHHGLAGVTFAVLGLLLALGVALVVRRALELLSASSGRTRRVALGAFWTGLGLAILTLGAVAGLRSASSSASLSPALPALGANTLAIDLLAFVLAAAFASRPIEAPRAQTAFAWGAVLAVVLVVVGAGSLGRVPGLEDELTRTSPFFALAASAPLAPASAD